MFKIKIFVTFSFLFLQLLFALTYRYIRTILLTNKIADMNSELAIG